MRAFLLVAIHAGGLCPPSVPRPAESQVPVSFLGLQGAWGAAGVCRPEKHADTLGVVRLEHQHVTVPRDTFSPVSSCLELEIRFSDVFGHSDGCALEPSSAAVHRRGLAGCSAVTGGPATCLSTVLWG